MPRQAGAADSLAAPQVPNALVLALNGWANRYLHQPPTPQQPVAVALSGGADSVALLLVAHAVWPGAVRAFHINHGLQAAAVLFEAVCVGLCERLDIPLEVVRVNVNLAAGASMEAEARRSRYAALATCAQSSSVQAVMLGQHADDQAETVLLALSRGAGLPGLAAMGDVSCKQGVWFGRPFLGIRGEVLRDWVVRSRIPYVDDPSNTDQRHTRNRIRHSVLPVLKQHFPAMVDTLSRTARHAAEASALLTEVAQQDLAVVGEPPSISGMQALTRARQANVLRYWLQRCAGAAPTTAQLDELLKQLAQCTTRGHGIALRVCAGSVHRRGGVLAYEPGH